MPHHNFRKPDHLPNHRRDGRPSAPEGLPRQRHGTTPQMHGRYPDYDVLALAGHWDETTRKVVLERVSEVPPLRFFDERQARTLGAFCDTVLAQDAEPRVPVLNMVDAKMHAGKLDGFRYHDMPEDPETWRRVAAGLDQEAGGDFAALGEDARRAVISRFADGELEGGVWDDLPPSKAWSVVMRGVLSEFYSHPWAWNEIGYGGPRYPRGYMRLGADRVEPGGAVEHFDVDPVPDVEAHGEA
jgi:hypothetical protein